MNMDPVAEARNASLLLIFDAVSPCIPYDYRIEPSETMKTFEKNDMPSQG